LSGVPPTGEQTLFSKVVFAIKELGLSTVLVVFICYLLVVQMAAMQRDLRVQTDKISEAVTNNNRVVNELIIEMRATRHMKGVQP
jgi:hypothetical protein